MVLASGQAPAGQAPVLREAVAEPAVAQLVVPTLAGVWAYSNPNAKKVDGVH